MDDDNDPEVIFTCRNKRLYALKSNRTFHNNFNTYEGALESDVMVMDYDGDGFPEYAFLSGDTARIALRETNTSLVDSLDLRTLSGGYNMGPHSRKTTGRKLFL
jgi:hypothetical protein